MTPLVFALIGLIILAWLSHSSQPGGFLNLGGNGGTGNNEGFGEASDGEGSSRSHIPRPQHKHLPFAQNSGTMSHLVESQSYQEPYYHGYFPWSVDDYAWYSPFDVNHPYFYN